MPVHLLGFEFDRLNKIDRMTQLGVEAILLKA